MFQKFGEKALQTEGNPLNYEKRNEEREQWSKSNKQALDFTKYHTVTPNQAIIIAFDVKQ